MLNNEHEVAVIFPSLCAEFRVEDVNSELSFPTVRPLVMPNLKIREPRDVLFQGDLGIAPCCYKHLKRIPQPWTPRVSALRTFLLTVQPSPSISHLPATLPKVNCSLINRYQSGADSMGLHCDADLALGPQPFILSVSLGTERSFIFKHNETGEAKRINLPHGTVVLMYGSRLQSNWKHGLRKTSSAEKQGMRINLSFRYHELRTSWIQTKKQK